jgi:hypothetical protein
LLLFVFFSHRMLDIILQNWICWKGWNCCSRLTKVLGLVLFCLMVHLEWRGYALICLLLMLLIQWAMFMLCQFDIWKHIMLWSFTMIFTFVLGFSKWEFWFWWWWWRWWWKWRWWNCWGYSDWRFSWSCCCFTFLCYSCRRWCMVFSLFF